MKKILTGLGRLFKKSPRQGRQQQKSAVAEKLSGNFSADEGLLREIFANCGDVKFRNLRAPALGNRRVLMVLVENLVNHEIVNRDVLGKLLVPPPPGEQKAKEDILDFIAVSQASRHGSLEKVKGQVLRGKTLLLQEGKAEALLVETRQWPARAVEEPYQERTIQGPRESFTEILRTNLGLIRRRLPTPTLKVEIIPVGRRTSCDVALIYFADVADPDVVDEVRSRVEAIDIDGILEPGAIGELITDNAWTPFPLQLNTERPDKVVGELLQGKVVLFADGSPFAKILPVTFADFNHSPDDYYVHPIFATLLRVLRFASFFIATTITAAYTAVVTFHYEMIPRELIVFIAESRQGVPFVPFLEAIFLEVAIELIREANLRLPSTIAGTIGIVGALVLGQAVVQARLVSPILLIIVALGFMASFALPNYEVTLPIRYLRFPLLLAGGLL